MNFPNMYWYTIVEEAQDNGNKLHQEKQQGKF